MTFRRKMTFFRMEVAARAPWNPVFVSRDLFARGVPKHMKTLLLASTRGVWGETW